MIGRFAAAAIAFALAGCGTSIVLPAAAGAKLDPVAFFAGRTYGEAKLEKVGSGPVQLRVDSVGRPSGDGLILDQIIREGDKPPRARRWTMRPVGPNRYSGTLTDAAGPVSVRTKGPRAYISYTMKNGMTVEQQLALQSDRRTVLNHLTVKKFGMKVAELSETIRKLD